MAVIKPFKGIRYNQQKAGDINELVTQPYDKISPILQDRYYQSSPYNIVRLIKNSSEDPYQEAKETLENWLSEGVLMAEEREALYIYHQEYECDGQRKVRKALTCLARTEDYADKVVLPHEKTHSGPKVDRLNLLRETEANFGQIFMLYDDPDKMIEEISAKYTDQPPLEKATDHFGDIHSLWKIEDRADIEQIQTILAEKQLMIADGHHRYGTACNFTQEKGFKLGTDNPYGYVLSTLVNIKDDGLTVLPTHRLITDDKIDIQDFLIKLTEYFQVSKVDEATMTEEVNSSGPSTFGCVTADGYYLLTLLSSAVMDSLSEMSKEWNSLDVSIVQKLIIEEILKINDDQLEEKLSYARDPQKAIERLKAGQADILFYLKATNIEQVIKIAQNGEYMPQKSTDFYPKLLTGMVFQKYNI